jgi:hypothetical protein
LLKELSDLLDRHPSAAFSHSGMVLVDPSGEVQETNFVMDYPELTPGIEFLVKVLLPNLDSEVSALTMVRGPVLNGKGMDPHFGPVSDIELWLRLCTIGDVAYTKNSLIKVRRRDPSSALFFIGCKITQKVLEAKRAYLHYTADKKTRAAIKASWRKDVSRACIMELWKALESRRRQDIHIIADFIDNEGTVLGRRLFRGLSVLPPGVALPTLRGVRKVRRRLTGLRTLRNSGA